jgi:hypothetical protein
VAIFGHDRLVSFRAGEVASEAGLLAIGRADVRCGIRPSVNAVALVLLVLALTLVGFALLAAGWGIYLLATEDVQGGRDFAGAVSIAAGVIAGGLAWLALRLARGRTA